MLPPKIVVSDQLKMFSVDRELFWRGGGGVRLLSSIFVSGAKCNVMAVSNKKAQIGTGENI